MVGHGTEQERWRLTWDRLHGFRSLGPEGLTDQQAGVQPAASGGPASASARLPGEGTHLLLVETHHAFSNLPGDRFQTYVTDEGLSAIAAHRLATGTTAANGRELYSRRAKALVQVGDRLTDDVLKPVGQTLEIVPERHPLALKPGESLPVRVLFRGRPLGGARIDLTHLEDGGGPVEAHRTDRDGRARFTPAGPGPWKLNVIWGWPIAGRKDADYESIFTSLTFRIPEAG
jgi:hypothetical protein